MLLFAALLGAAAAAAAVPTFVHPGVFLNASDLAIIRSRLAAREEPQASAFAAAAASPLGSLSYRPYGPPADGIVTCGSYDKPNLGCSNETTDADAAFLHALFFALGGVPAHAALSLATLRAWSAGLRAYNNSNAPLQAAWCGAKWARAAELLRHTAGSGWGGADTAAVSAMFTRVHLPLIYKGSPANGNWESSMNAAMLGFAVFLEDADLFSHAVGFWRQRTPAYFYNNVEDGPTHRPLPPGRSGDTTWYNQTVFNASTNGVCQETCRDFGHVRVCVCVLGGGGGLPARVCVCVREEGPVRILCPSPTPPLTPLLPSLPRADANGAGRVPRRGRHRARRGAGPVRGGGGAAGGRHGVRGGVAPGGRQAAVPPAVLRGAPQP